jgi:hypothetical protein
MRQKIMIFAKHINRGLVRAGLLALLGCIASYANIVTIPAGLTPGTQYQLVFVTNDSVLGDLPSISDYNTFVANQAVHSVDADVNSPSTGLVYTLNGAEVASIGVYGVNGANPNGSSLLNPIDINQFGDFENTFVWTGSGNNGFGGGGNSCIRRFRQRF